MVKDFLKNTGKLITAVILLIIISFPAYTAEIRSELTRNRISEGESVTLKVMISGSTSNIRPLKVPAVQGLNINLSGTSRSFQFINGKSWTGIILNFTIEAETKGVYRIPPFMIEADGDKLQTAEFVLTVNEGEEGSSVSHGSLRGEIELTSSEIYAGEPVIMRYYLRTDNTDVRIEGMREQPDSRGFVIKHIKEGDNATGEDAGNGRIYIASYCLVAAETGSHDIGGGAVIVSGETGGGFFSQIIRRDIHFPKKLIKVKALPAANRPEKYSGDVGDFSIRTEEASGSFREGEEIHIPVIISGRGNLLMMSKPALEKQDDIKLLVEEKEPVLSIDNRTLAGEKKYILTIIPERSGQCNIGKIVFPYFNPYKKVYEKAESIPLSYIVSPSNPLKNSEDKKAPAEEKNSWPRIILTASVIIILACGVILFLQIGRYRIVKTESFDEKKTEPESVVIDHKKFFREELEKAYTLHDYESFLQKSEKLAGAIVDDSKDKSSAGELIKVKEKISLYRYGGASYTDEDMKKIYDDIKKLS